MRNPDMLTEILERIKGADVPDTFNARFLSTVLGFKGGDAVTFLSWAKNCGLLTTDGIPTDLYREFRSPSTSRAAMAQVLKIGYSELFRRNAYAHELDEKELEGHVLEIAGSSKTRKIIDDTCQSFKYAKAFADFGASLDGQARGAGTTTRESGEEASDTGGLPLGLADTAGSIKHGHNYTINIVLPITDDPNVYSAIFRALKKNLLE